MYAILLFHTGGRLYGGGGGATDHGANISAGYQPSENHSTIAYAVNEIMVVIEILSYVLIYIQQFC